MHMRVCVHTCVHVQVCVCVLKMAFNMCQLIIYDLRLSHILHFLLYYLLYLWVVKMVGLLGGIVWSI